MTKNEGKNLKPKKKRERLLEKETMNMDKSLPLPLIFLYELTHTTVNCSSLTFFYFTLIYHITLPQSFHSSFSHGENIPRTKTYSKPYFNYLIFLKLSLRLYFTNISEGPTSLHDY